MNLFNKSHLKKQMMFAHNLIVASIPLLEMAIEKSTGELKEYYERHVFEEAGHAEILEEDLKSLGITDIAINPDAVEIAGAQYYLIAHVHPAALLGYMAALERHNVPEALITELEKHHEVTLKCMRLHTLLDVEHIKDLDEQIERLRFDLKKLAKDNEDYVVEKINRACNWGQI